MFQRRINGTTEIHVGSPYLDTYLYQAEARLLLLQRSAPKATAARTPACSSWRFAAAMGVYQHGAPRVGGSFRGPIPIVEWFGLEVFQGVSHLPTHPNLMSFLAGRRGYILLTSTFILAYKHPFLPHHAKGTIELPTSGKAATGKPMPI